VSDTFKRPFAVTARGQQQPLKVRGLGRIVVCGDRSSEATAVYVLKREICAVPTDYTTAIIEQFSIRLAKDPYQRSVPFFATKHLYASSGQLQYWLSICRCLDIREETEARRSGYLFAAGRGRRCANDGGASHQAHGARENSDCSKYT
jgi:hypothetical protein